MTVFLKNRKTGEIKRFCNVDWDLYLIDGVTDEETIIELDFRDGTKLVLDAKIWQELERLDDEVDIMERKLDKDSQKGSDHNHSNSDTDRSEREPERVPAVAAENRKERTIYTLINEITTLRLCVKMAYIDYRRNDMLYELFEEQALGSLSTLFDVNYITSFSEYSDLVMQLDHIFRMYKKKPQLLRSESPLSTKTERSEPKAPQAIKNEVLF